MVAPVPRLLVLLVAASLLSCRGDEAPAPPEVVGPWNDRRLEERDAPPFSFLALGHVYGRPGPNRPRPASTLTANGERLRASGADLMVMLGDSVFAFADPEVARLETFLRELPFPVFNAPGNHELSDRPGYLARFGPTWSAFDHGGCRFVLTDSEIDPWFISGAQLAFVQAEIARALDPRTRPRALFVFGHKPLWAGTRNTAVASLKSNTPTTLGVFASRPPEAPTFGRDLRPRLRELAREIPVWCFAGDVGAFEEHTLHLFMERDPKAPKLRYLAVGLGDVARDAFLKVRVPATGEPEVEAIELGSGKVLDMASFDSAYWMAHFFPDGLPEAALPFIEQD